MTLAVLSRALPAAAGTAALLLALSACGGSSTATTGSGTGAAGNGGSGNSSGGSGGGFASGRLPGASGKIAALSGKTMQVQSEQSGQVAVTYTSSTTFTQQAVVGRSALAVGDCVMVGSTSAGGSSGGSSGSSSVAASSVRITQPVKGSCTTAGRGGFGAGGPGRGQGAPQGAPSGASSGASSGAPSGMPSGGPSAGARGGFRGGFGGAFGKVTALTSGGFTVQTSFGAGSSSAGTRKVTVTTSSATTWTATTHASASALAVGKCVLALGQADDTGAVTARTISISKPSGGSCSTGFGGGGQRPAQGS